MNQYIDKSGRFVSRDEAVDEGGMVRPGYSVRVSLLATDAAPTRMMFFDSPSISDSDIRAFSGSADGQAVIQRERRKHEASRAHMGADARPFDPAEAMGAVHAAMLDKRRRDGLKAGIAPAAAPVTGWAEGERLARKKLMSEAWR